MVDIERLRARYAAMPDELLLFLSEDSYDLTSEALLVLHQTLEQRGLQAGKQASSLFPAEQTAFSAVTREAAKKQVLRWKAEGEDEDMIAVRLQNEGLDEVAVILLLNEVQRLLQEQLLEADGNRIGAFIRLCCGVAVFIIAFLAGLSNGVYFMGLLLVALSIVQAAIIDTKRSRLKKMLRNKSSEITQAET